MPSNTTNDVINVYFWTTIVSAFFFMRPSSGQGLQKDGCLKLVDCNFVGGAGSRYKRGIFYK
jgi:hypothetical protein